MTNKNAIASLKMTKNECLMMSQLAHPNIIRLIEFKEEEDYYKTNGSTRKVMYIV